MTIYAVASIIGLIAVSAALITAAIVVADHGIKRRDVLWVSAAIFLAALGGLEAMAALHVWRFVP